MGQERTCPLISYFKMKEIKTKSKKETKDFGIVLGKIILTFGKNVFIALKGGLGSGKTTLIQGIAKGLEIKEDINSPTFLIYKKYFISDNKWLYHFDAYRIEEKDLSNIGFDEIVKEKGNIVIVEWSENIKKRLPQERVEIKFFIDGKNKRRLIVKDNSGIITGRI